MNIENDIKINISKLLNLNIDDIQLEIPNDKRNGDFSSNVCLKFSKRLNKNPLDLASYIKDNLNNKYVDNIVVAKPGFINFYLKKDYLFDTINNILKYGIDYFKLPNNNIKVNLEYVSANPTGTLHLGHARGACYGDSLSNILKRAGYDVTKEYYINDAGNQMNNLGISIKERYKELLGLECNLPENGYHGKEIIAIAKQLIDKYNDTLLDKDIDYYKKIGLDILLDGIKDDLKDIGVEYDVWTSEQSIYDNGEIDNVLKYLNDNDLTYTKDGALYLKTTKYYDDKDRVLIKNDGAYTYFLPDIAYHNDKYKRGYDIIIDVLGSDHHGYINRLKSSMEILNNDSNKLEIKILQLVRLIKDGKEFKMSKRTGKSITISELNDMIGKDALRYFYVAKSLDSQMDIDIDIATKKSNENPVYYIQYAHARICSILDNAKDIEIKNNTKFRTINSDIAYDIMKKIYCYKNIIELSAKKRMPHIVANYIYELASMFHAYYASEKFITDDIEATSDRIMLLKAIKIVISDALKLIGVSAPTKM